MCRHHTVRYQNAGRRRVLVRKCPCYRASDTYIYSFCLHLIYERERERERERAKELVRLKSLMSPTIKMFLACGEFKTSQPPVLPVIRGIDVVNHRRKASVEENCC